MDHYAMGPSDHFECYKGSNFFKNLLKTLRDMIFEKGSIVK
jgi:hypothetical protein